MTEKSAVENKKYLRYRGVVRSRVFVHLCTEQSGRSSDECPVCSAGQTAGKRKFESQGAQHDKLTSETQWCHEHCRVLSVGTAEAAARRQLQLDW